MSLIASFSTAISPSTSASIVFVKLRNGHSSVLGSESPCPGQIVATHSPRAMAEVTTAMDLFPRRAGQPSCKKSQGKQRGVTDRTSLSCETCDR